MSPVHPPTTAEDINLLSTYLANAEITNLSTHNPVDCIVIAVSAVLQPASVLFETLQARPDLTKTLVICGGKGHSTPLIYAAVARHEKYASIAKEIEGLSEAEVLFKILQRFYDVEKITSQGCRIRVEGMSTNCYLNAVETRKVLEENGCMKGMKSCIVIQDPTMALRTTLCFRKVFEDTGCVFKTWPGFVPRMKVDGEEVVFDVDGLEDGELWDKQRFFDLILGEIPRLRDDENGYGPRGTGSIDHVDIPRDVEDAWGRLKERIASSR